jgi:hypothetical protein
MTRKKCREKDGEEEGSKQSMKYGSTENRMS